MVIYDLLFPSILVVVEPDSDGIPMRIYFTIIDVAIYTKHSPLTEDFHVNFVFCFHRRSFFHAIDQKYRVLCNDT